MKEMRQSKRLIDFAKRTKQANVSTVPSISVSSGTSNRAKVVKRTKRGLAVGGRTNAVKKSRHFSTKADERDKVKTKSKAEERDKVNTKSKPKQKVVTFNPPEDWEATYASIKLLRKERNAPVDSMGSEVLAEKCHGDKVFRFQVLSSLLLSSQTRDQQVSKAIKNLQNGLKPSFCVDAVLEMDQDAIMELVRPVGFYKTKAKNLKKIAEVMKNKYDSDVPRELQSLVKDFPGIGPKMAYITLNVVYSKPYGIGVDVRTPVCMLC